MDWADVATKQDLAALEERMDERFERMEERMDERFERMEERMDLRFDAMAARMDHMAERLDLKFEGRLHDELRKQSLLFGSWVTAVAGVSIALVQLLSTG